MNVARVLMRHENVYSPLSLALLHHCCNQSLSQQLSRCGGHGPRVREGRARARARARSRLANPNPNPDPNQAQRDAQVVCQIVWRRCLLWQR